MSLCPLVLCFFSLPARAQELDTVEVDFESGTASDRLPFDVPFLLIGEAPNGSIAVELEVEEKASGDADFPADRRAATPLSSSVPSDARVRFRLGPFDPNRDFRFHLTFDRRLSSSEALELGRDLRSRLDRDLFALVSPIGVAEAARLRDELRLALERALNRGQPISPARGELEIQSEPALFGSDSSESAVRETMETLLRDVLARQAEREESLGLIRDTVPDLERELERLRSSAAVKTLVSELERRPELDPRNPRNAAFLSAGALTFLQGSEAEIAALARGRSVGESGIEPEESTRPSDADAVRARYLRTARDLRELDDWLVSLASPGGAHREIFERVATETGGLDEDARRELLSLANDEQNALRRAQRWAEVLEAYLYDLQRSLVARENALQAVAIEIESVALGAKIRQTTTTDVLSTRANLYVGLDIGVLYSPELERAAGYFGANVYFAPVNKRASLSYAGGLRKRLSMTFGITLTELVLEDDPRIEPLLGSRYNLALGLGYRFARSLRVSGGTLLVLKNDPNPLVVDRTLAWTPYFAFSFDVDVVGALRAAAR